MEPNTMQEPGSSMTTSMLIGGAVLALLVLGGVLLWQWPATTTMESAYSDVDSESWMPSQLGGTDEAAEIEAELESTDMSGFESQMNADLEAAASSL